MERTDYGSIHDGKIYCGKKAFDFLKEKLKSASSDGVFYHGGICFVLNSMMSEFSILTLDKDIKIAFEELETVLNNKPAGNKE